MRHIHMEYGIELVCPRPLGTRDDPLDLRAVMRVIASDEHPVGMLLKVLANLVIAGLREIAVP